MKKRDSFTNRLGFILACVGSAVGMGNLWMFPTRVSLYGGGSFLIPYFIFVVLIGATGVIGEMAFGRAARSGPVNAFGMALESRGKRKLGEALGLIPMVGALAMAIGYTVVMGWILTPSAHLPVQPLPLRMSIPMRQHLAAWQAPSAITGGRLRHCSSAS